MEERRKNSKYRWGKREVDALLEAMKQLVSISIEMENNPTLREIYKIEFSIGDIKYSILTKYPTRLPEMIFSAIESHLDSKRGIEGMVD